MKLDPTMPKAELQSAMALELSRLATIAKDVETHLEDALHSTSLQETTVTGIQQIDAIAQILEQLSALAERASGAHPMSPAATEELIAEVTLISLQHRLQSSGATPAKSDASDVDFF